MKEESRPNSRRQFSLPDCVRAMVLCNGASTAGLFVKVCIRTSFKNDFFSLFGPSDSAGVITFTRSDLLREGDRDRKLFLMDYGHPEIDYAGQLTVAPASRADLGRALDAYHQFQLVVPYPDRYAEQLQEARVILEQLSPAELGLSLSITGGTGEVVSCRVAA